MHMGNMAKGMLPAIAIVGGGIPLATGMALALKMQQAPQVVACFFGDGATSEGAFHEGVNMAAIWDLPVLFVCENNLYGASTHVSKIMRNTTIVDRAGGYGIPRRNRGRQRRAGGVRGSRQGRPRNAGPARARCCSNCSPTAPPAIRAATPAITSRKKSGKRWASAIRSSASREVLVCAADMPAGRPGCYPGDGRRSKSPPAIEPGAAGARSRPWPI